MCFREQCVLDEPHSVTVLLAACAMSMNWLWLLIWMGLWTWNHLGYPFLGVSMRTFPERFSGGGKTHLICLNHSLNTKGKGEEARWTPAFICLSSWLWLSMTSHPHYCPYDYSLSCFHVFPPLKDCISLRPHPHKKSLPLSSSCLATGHSNRKSKWYRVFIEICVKWGFVILSW